MEERGCVKDFGAILEKITQIKAPLVAPDRILKPENRLISQL